MSATLLESCESLIAVAAEDVTTFRQLFTIDEVSFEVRDDRPATTPVKLLPAYSGPLAAPDRVLALSRELRRSARRIDPAAARLDMALVPVLPSASATRTARALEPAVSPFDRHRGRQGGHRVPVVDVMPTLVQSAHVVATAGGAGGTVGASAAAVRPMVGVSVSYEQRWVSQGYLRGRLLRSIPLTPGEQLQVTIRSWDKQTSRDTVVTTAERSSSLDVAEQDTWSLATKKTFSDETNVSVDAKAGVEGDVTIPVKGVPVRVGANGDVGSSLSHTIRNAAERSNSFVHDRTVKAALSLKQSRTSTVDISRDTGSETTTTQTLSNTNRSRTVNFHYFEVAERFTVTTRPTGAHLCLLVRLPLPDVTPMWLLVNECNLRSALLCDEVAAGFAAARQLLIDDGVREVLIDFAARLEQKRIAREASGPTLGSAVETALEAYASLRDANVLALAGEGGDDFIAAVKSTVDDFVDTVDDLSRDAQNAVQQGVDAVADVADKTLKMGEDLVKRVGDAFSALPKLF